MDTLNYRYAGVDLAATKELRMTRMATRRSSYDCITWVVLTITVIIDLLLVLYLAFVRFLLGSFLVSF